MAREKDRYGNNLGRGTRVKDLSDEENGDGVCNGTGLNGMVLVKWDNKDEEELRLAADLLVTERRFK